MKMILLSLFSLGFFAPAHADVHSDLEFTLKGVRDAFHSNYAAAEFKKEMFNWDIDQEFSKLLKKGTDNTELSVFQAQSLVNEYFLSARDYHAQARLGGQAYVYLDIGVHSANGKVFITSVDKSHYSGKIKVGDELLTADHENAMQAIYHLVSHPQNHARTDLRDAERRLTSRYGLLFDPIPTAKTFEVTLRNAAGEVYAESLPWRNPSSAKTMAAPQTHSLLKGYGEDPFGYGAHFSYLPKPAKVISEVTDPNTFFYSWIGLTAGGKRVGMIRISTFNVGSSENFTAAVSEFSKLIQKMNAETDLLILDTQGNRGGAMDYTHALLSFFFDHSVKATRFQYRLFPKLVKEFQDDLVDLAKVKTQADAEAYAEGKDYEGYPVSVSFIRDLESFEKAIVEDSVQNKLLSRALPYHQKISPYPGVQTYTKPVVVMTDEWTGSCGDFFAAFFQDQKRALIAGTQSQGAGAFTGDTIGIQNPLQFTGFVVPIAIAYRRDGSAIENHGVTPDFYLAPDAWDLKNATYSHYRHQLYDWVDDLELSF